MNAVARKGDPTRCPRVDPKTKVPHVGKGITGGARTVFAGGSAVAHVGCPAACKADEADSVETGSGSVLVEDQPIARVGSQTAHGGAVTGGCGTVLVG